MLWKLGKVMVKVGAGKVMVEGRFRNWYGWIWIGGWFKNKVTIYIYKVGRWRVMLLSYPAWL